MFKMNYNRNTIASIMFGAILCGGIFGYLYSKKNKKDEDEDEQ